MIAYSSGIRLLTVSFALPCFALAQFTPPPGSPPASFTPPVAMLASGAGPQPSDIVTGDWNGDGVADYATTGTNGAVTTSFGIAGSPLTIVAGQVVTLPAFSVPTSLVAGDFDGDGDSDLAVYTAGSAQPAVAASVQLLTNSGAGAFVLGPSVTLPRIPFAGVIGSYGLASADLNGDLLPDLVAPTIGGLQPIVSRPGVLGLGAVVAATAQPTGIAIGDMNGNGRPDIAAVTNNLTAPTAGNIEFFINTTAGPLPTFAPSPLPLAFVDALAHGIIVADLDQDGISDVAVSTLQGFFTVLDPLNSQLVGGGALAPFSGSLFDRAIEALDVDGDGSLDLAIAGQFSTFTIQRQVAPGTFLGPQGPFSSVGGIAAMDASRDVDSDGLPDVVTLGLGTGPISLWVNRQPSAAWTVPLGSPCGLGTNPVMAVTPPQFSTPLTISITGARASQLCTLGATAPNASYGPTTPFAFPSCQLWLNLADPAPAVVQLFTDAAGAATLTVGGPPVIPSLIGLELVVQALIGNIPPGGTGNGLDVTNGVGLVFGF